MKPWSTHVWFFFRLPGPSKASYSEITFNRLRLHLRQESLSCLKARLHRRFLSRQLDAIFVVPRLQLQNRMCKPGAIFSTICHRDIAGVSNMFETCCNFSATKIASSCPNKNCLCKRVFKQGQGMRGRATTPHPGIYRVPPPPGQTLLWIFILAGLLFIFEK